MHRAFGFVLAVVLIMGTGCGSGTDAGSSTPEATSPVTGCAPEPSVDGVVTFTLESFKITPACASISPSDSLSIKNVGDIPHTWTVEGREGDLDFEVQPGEFFNSEPGIPLAAGEYNFYCRFHPDQMSGTLEVSG